MTLQLLDIYGKIMVLIMLRENKYPYFQYSDAVEYASYGEKNLTEAYTDYAIWRYFTGERSMANLFFDEASFYCSSSTESFIDSSFTIQADKGAIFMDLIRETTYI